MKTNTIKAKKVYSEKKQKTVYLKQKNETWFPINFQWIPVVKLNNELNLKTNKMKNIINLAILILFALLSSCSKDEDLLSGSRNLITEGRNIGLFTKVSSEGVFDVTITQGSPQSLEITADNNIINQVRTRVINNELKLYLDNDYNYRDISLKANIVVEKINGIINTGVGNIIVSNVNETGNFNVYNSGTGNITVGGSAESLTIENEGTGKFKGFQFMISNCDVEIIGSGDCEINVANRLNVDVKGSGDVYYLGSPIIDANISGSGKIISSN